MDTGGNASMQPRKARYQFLSRVGTYPCQHLSEMLQYSMVLLEGKIPYQMYSVLTALSATGHVAGAV